MLAVVTYRWDATASVLCQQGKVAEALAMLDSVAVGTMYTYQLSW